MVPVPSGQSQHEQSRIGRPDKEGRQRVIADKNKRIILQTQEVCGICGRPVDKTLRYPHPLSPTVDHIIPIAKGGHPSALENMQLAHFTCNRMKSDKMIEVKEQTKAEEKDRNRNLPLSCDWKKYRG